RTPVPWDKYAKPNPYDDCWVVSAWYPRSALEQHLGCGQASQLATSVPQDRKSRGRRRVAKVQSTTRRVYLRDQSRLCHRDVRLGVCRSGLAPRADGIVEACGRKSRCRPTKQGRRGALGRALRLDARLSLRGGLGYLSCGFTVRRLRTALGWMGA